MGLSGESRTVVMPGTDVSMQAWRITANDFQFEAWATRCNYLVQDRSGIQFVAMGVRRRVSASDEAAWRRLKKTARYPEGERRVVYEHHQQQPTNEITTWIGVNPAGCEEAREGTSGDVITPGGYCIKTRSPTRPRATISSGETEYGSTVEVTSEGMGVQSMLNDIDYDFKLTLNTDSTACTGISIRHGLGKVKHLDIGELWVQEKAMDGTTRMNKVPGDDTLADLLTKHSGRGEVDKHMEKPLALRRRREHALAQCDSRIQRNAELHDRLLEQFLRVEAFVQSHLVSGQLPAQCRILDADVLFQGHAVLGVLWRTSKRRWIAQPTVHRGCTIQGEVWEMTHLSAAVWLQTIISADRTACHEKDIEYSHGS